MECVLSYLPIVDEHDLYVVEEAAKKSIQLSPSLIDNILTMSGWMSSRVWRTGRSWSVTDAGGAVLRLTRMGAAFTVDCRKAKIKLASNKANEVLSCMIARLENEARFQICRKDS